MKSTFNVLRLAPLILGIAYMIIVQPGLTQLTWIIAAMLPLMSIVFSIYLMNEKGEKQVPSLAPPVINIILGAVVVAQPQFIHMNDTPEGLVSFVPLALSLIALILVIRVRRDKLNRGIA